MDAGTAGLIGAAIGGGLAILKSFVDSRSQLRLEKAKAEWARANDVDTQFREHVATVARELLSAQHSIEWFCAITDHNNRLTPEFIKNYHAEIHGTFPKLLGALATVSTLNDRAYKELSSLAERIFVLDAAIVDALRGFDTSPGDASSKVAEQRAEATELYKKLPISIARIIKDLRP